ncbi:MAG TPA: hypothetical protein VMK13_06865 [Streptosporangiaceae bacterium]|nr:hypothetical protein [Streptosporangiaceae bacterium]
MSVPTRTSPPDLTRSEELAVSGAVMSNAPWAVAGAAGAVAAGADMLGHLAFAHFAVGAPLSLGAVIFFAVAGGGALLRRRQGDAGRAMRWARRNPWRFAIVPGAACAIVVFVLTVLLGGGVVGGAFTAVWHGAAAFGLTGLTGSVARGRRRTR